MRIATHTRHDVTEKTHINWRWCYGFYAYMYVKSTGLFLCSSVGVRVYVLLRVESGWRELRSVLMVYANFLNVRANKISHPYIWHIVTCLCVCSLTLNKTDGICAALLSSVSQRHLYYMSLPSKAYVHIISRYMLYTHWRTYKKHVVYTKYVFAFFFVIIIIIILVYALRINQLR